MMAHQQSFMIEIYFYDQNPNGNPHTHTHLHLHIHTLEPDVKPCKLILVLPPAVEHLSHVSFHLWARVLGPFFFLPADFTTWFSGFRPDGHSGRRVIIPWMTAHRTLMGTFCRYIYFFSLWIHRNGAHGTGLNVIQMGKLCEKCREM